MSSDVNHVEGFLVQDSGASGANVYATTSFGSRFLANCCRNQQASELQAFFSLSFNDLQMLAELVLDIIASG
jgi:hypothetical protein